MKKKIAIIGSTGSIGKTLIKLLKNNKKKYQIVLLSANSDYKTLLRQAKDFKVRNLIITNKDIYQVLKKKKIGKKIKIYNDFENLNVIFKKQKIDYLMSAITGIEGLSPTLKVIKYTKKIAVANKESIICGWNLILKELKKHKTKFIPVDSEHFSLWYGLNNLKVKNIQNIFITASGGPFLKYPINRFKKITVAQALKHPNWNMGKKISVDSATMINKVYEVIEAKNIFNLPYNKIHILIHPKSYIHAIIKFKNGMIKIIAHDTTMKVPISNTLYDDNDQTISSTKLNIENLNNLNLKKIDIKRYPILKLLKILPKNYSLFETIIVSANDTLVDLFLKKKILFIDIYNEMMKFIKRKEFSKYKNIKPKNIREIIKLNNYVRLKILKKVYTS